MRRIVQFSSAVSLAALLAVALTAARQAPSGPHIDVTFTAAARATAVTGRVYVAISRTNDRSPIDQTDPTGVPLFALNVEGLAPGDAAAIGPGAAGYPVASLRDLPAGDYWMEPF